jgi:hypothetical protein
VSDPLTTDERCNWVEDSDGNWATACGNQHCLDPNEPPEAHGMKFCCYCGKKLASFSYKESDEDEEDDEPPEPDGECFRGGEYASALAEEQAWIQRNLK